jgi:hypothetical protein
MKTSYLSQSLVAALIVGASSAALAKMYCVGDADSFEEGTNGMPAACYKTVQDDSGAVTSAVWFASEGDASELVGADAGNTGYGNDRPMIGTTTDRVLELNTGGGCLTRRVSGGGMNCYAGTVYIDMLVQFVPFDEPPVISQSLAKLAVYLNAQSNLVVYHGGLFVTSTVTDVTLDPASWHRLTVNAFDTLYGIPCGKVYIDGMLVTSSASYLSLWSEPGAVGYLFPFTTEDGSIQAVGFEGRGRVDELRVTDNDLYKYSPMLLVFNDAHLDVLFAGQVLQPGDTVDNGAEISIRTDGWHAFSVTGNCGCVEYSGPVGERVSSSTGLVTAAHAANVVISTSLLTGVTLGTNVVDEVLLASWAQANGKSADDVESSGNDWLDDYLLNVAPDTDASIMISSIAYNASAGTATITVSASSPAVRFDQLNGTLTVYTCSDLKGGWGEPVGNYQVSLADTGEATVVVPVSAGPFIKVAVK